MNTEYILEQKEKIIKVLKDQIALKDKQLEELIKAYGVALLERD
jgi:hypothetical protein